MKLMIASPGFRTSPSLKEFVNSKLGNLNRYYKTLQVLEVTLVNEVKGNKEVVNCTIHMRIPGKDEYVKASSYIFEDAILKAAGAARRRLQSRKAQQDDQHKRKTILKKPAVS